MTESVPHLAYLENGAQKKVESTKAGDGIEVR